MCNYLEYLEIPYKFNGTSKDEGFDCNTLVSQIAKEDGYFIPNVNHINKSILTFHHLFPDEIKSGKWEEMPRGEKRVVIFNIFNPKNKKTEISHMGWMINNHQFIHIMGNTSVSIESVKSPAWERRVAGYYRYKGLK
jgi:cell wall-associated NlpC family hydrolase